MQAESFKFIRSWIFSMQKQFWIDLDWGNFDSGAFNGIKMIAIDYKNTTISIIWLCTSVTIQQQPTITDEAKV